MDICLLQLKSATRERGKRGRKLLIDSCKVLSSQMIRSQISDYTDITHRARSLPPVSSRAIQCRGSADESLLAMPAIVSAHIDNLCSTNWTMDIEIGCYSRLSLARAHRNIHN